jgi:hypothetical protein
MPKSLMHQTFSDTTSQSVLRLDGCSWRSTHPMLPIRGTLAPRRPGAHHDVHS